MRFIPQADADALLHLAKKGRTDVTYQFPTAAQRLALPLWSMDDRVEFMLSVLRGRIVLGKCSYHGQTRSEIFLARLDVGGAPHTNPDGIELLCPHLHLYREGYGDSWAYAVPSDKFTDLGDLFETLQDFMRFVNVTTLPTVERNIWTA